MQDVQFNGWCCPIVTHFPSRWGVASTSSSCRPNRPHRPHLSQRRPRRLSYCLDCPKAPCHPATRLPVAPPRDLGAGGRTQPCAPSAPHVVDLDRADAMELH